MKRFLILVVCLVVIPVFSFAKTTPGEVVGWWSIFTDTGFSLLFFQEDKTAYSFETITDESGECAVKMRTGEWAIIEDDTVVCSFSDGSIQKATYMNDKLYYHLSAYSGITSMGMLGMTRQKPLTYATLDVELIP